MLDKRVQIVDADSTCPTLELVEGPGEARAVIWPGMGAHLRSLHLIELGEGAKTVQQQHPMEAVYYVIEGDALALDVSDGTRSPAPFGSMIFVEPGTAYEIHSDGRPVRVVGGPCPPDPSLYQDIEP